MKDYRVQEVIQYPETVASSTDVDSEVEPTLEDGLSREIRQTAPPPVVTA